MENELYAKVKKSARYCRDPKLRRKIALFLEVIRTGNTELACKRMGVARSSYYRWWQRYRGAGFKIEALIAHSRRPKNSPRRLSEAIIRKIRRYRFCYHYGPERIQKCLWEQHGIRVGKTTIRKIILKRGWLLKKYRTQKVNPHKKRYELPSPGFIQMDIKYVPRLIQGKQVYEYNAIDECSRWRFMKAYKEMSTINAVDFVRDLVKAAPFTIFRIQTDNDLTFTYRFSPHGFDKRHPLESTMEELGIDHRLIPPGAKELNGKVERSHRIDEDEFFWKADYRSFEPFQQDLARWNYAYNHYRPHGGIGQRTPMEKLTEKMILPYLALWMHWRKITWSPPRPKVILGVRIDTYLKYLDWIERDPFHFSDVRDFYMYPSRPRREPTHWPVGFGVCLLDRFLKCLLKTLFPERKNS